MLIPKIKKKSILSMLERDLRLDGRSPNQYRDISVHVGVIEKAEGSALAKIGNTVALVGIKVGVGTPFPDLPDQGVLAVNAEFVPLAFPTFEPGPPDENAVELARIIDRSLRELDVVDLKKMTIIPGEKVYIIWLDIYVLDHDGNLTDACMLASMAALLNTKVPKAEADDRGFIKLNKDEATPLPVNRRVVIVSIGKVGGKLIVDPNLEEEQVLEAKLSISIGDNGVVAGMQKTGLSSFTQEEVEKAVEIALNKSKELFTVIDEALKKPSSLWEALRNNG